MRQADGVGIAAPQVGILRQAVICELDTDVEGETEILEMMNPEILEKSGKQIGSEGCLSVPGKRCEVQRPKRIKVRFQNRKGEVITRVLEGFNAVVASHEIDHLSGVLFYDREYKEKA